MTGGSTVNCGCAGKTPLERIVHPARRKARATLAASSAHLAGALDSGLLPLTDGLDRELVVRGIDSPERATLSGRTWALSAVLPSVDDTRTADRFRDLLEREYSGLGDGPTVIAKGHSVQLPDATRSVHATELLRPTGPRRPGFRAGNVDLIHAFPKLDPPDQAAVATAHAFNDCYAYGATGDRTLRPFVAVPTDDCPRATTVTRWYRQRVPSSVTVLDPAIIPHDGEGWLYGAAVTATTDRVPPIHRGRLRAGDEVLLHRPLGAVACYAQALEDGDEALKRTATTHLRADHETVGEIVRAFRPEPWDAFDPDRHVKLATDVSGPGIAGIARLVEGKGFSLRVDDLPFLDSRAVTRAREQWLVPDATIGTNGPLAFIGRSSVLDRVASRLREKGVAGHRLGTVVDSPGPSLRGDDAVSVAAYVEDPITHRNHEYARGRVDT